MVRRDLEDEFERLRRLLVGRVWSDDNGPVFAIEDVAVVDRSAGVIAGRIWYVDERDPTRPVRTSDFDYEFDFMAADGPEDDADLLLVNLDEEVLAAG